MLLYLMRHADPMGALEAKVAKDAERPLSKKGHTQATHMARVLRVKGARPQKLLVSPARRTQETALPFEKEFQLKAEVHRELMSGAFAEDVIAFLEKYLPYEEVLVIGHEPTMGETIAHLTAGQHIGPRPRASIACVDYDTHKLIWDLSPKDASLLRGLI